MRTRVLLSLVAAAIAAVALVSASGAATTKAQKAARIDVSTRAAVVKYLRSIHVSSKGVVIQRGLRNYAGTGCPGRGWSCTRTTHTVVQVAKAGGRNTFSCTTAKCAVVQVAMAPAALTNTAACIKTTGLSQSCTISQSSSTKDNVAIVYEDATKASGLTQTATSTASITQRATGAANANTACVFQNINMTGSTVAKTGTPVSVTLEAHQTVTIRQDSMHGANAAAQSATSSGHCTGSAVTQTQMLKSVANGSGQITQNENTAAKGPNVSLDIEQNQSSGFTGSATGANSVAFSQTSNLQAVANTPKGPVSQTQSSPDTSLPYSGLVGTVNQDSQGVSTADVVQTETQCEDAAISGLSSCHTAPGDSDFNGSYALHQTQYGPEGIYKAPTAGQGPVHYVHKGIGTATQTGNSNDTFTIDQKSQQDNDTGDGQTNTVQGDCSTSGTCTTTQQTTVNGSTTQDTQSGQNVSSSINCTGSDCTATPPPTPTITDGPPNPSNSSDASFSFTDADPTVTFECQLDGGGYQDCTSPASYSELADGQHTFYVKAKNSTGQESDPASYTWTIETGSSPVTVLQLNPSTDPGSGGCGDSFASGTGFNGTPQKVHETADLSQFDGQPIQLRFAFSTGDGQFNKYEGWYVNNIQVTGIQGDSPVTVFSDPVADGDTTFTASSDFGVTPGWHVSDRRSTDLGGPAWWYGNETTGTYQSPDPISDCSDSAANAGTITSPVFTLASNSQLSFDTLWQIEGVNPSSFDLMDVQVIPASVVVVAPKRLAAKATR